MSTTGKLPLRIWDTESPKVRYQELLVMVFLTGFMKVRSRANFSFYENNFLGHFGALPDSAKYPAA